MNYILDVWLGLNTPLESNCSGNIQKAILRQLFLQNSNFNETGLYKRENLKENIIVKASF